MKQSSITSRKENANGSIPSRIETKQNENQVAVAIIFIAVAGLILFSLQ